MTPQELKQLSQLPDQVSPLIRALWHDARGEWTAAHALAQEESSTYGSWVHAYLHRKEGDLSNATYWYRRAGKNPPTVSLEQEWESIARSLLDGNS